MINSAGLKDSIDRQRNNRQVGAKIIHMEAKFCGTISFMLNTGQGIKEEQDLSDEDFRDLVATMAPFLGSFCYPVGKILHAPGLPKQRLGFLVIFLFHHLLFCLLLYPQEWGCPWQWHSCQWYWWWSCCRGGWQQQWQRHCSQCLCCCFSHCLSCPHLSSFAPFPVASEEHICGTWRSIIIIIIRAAGTGLCIVFAAIPRKQKGRKPHTIVVVLLLSLSVSAEAASSSKSLLLRNWWTQCLMPWPKGGQQEGRKGRRKRMMQGRFERLQWRERHQSAGWSCSDSMKSLLEKIRTERVLQDYFQS